MLTHVTRELPEVVEAAGLPIVRPRRQLATNLLTSRVHVGFEPSVDIWSLYGRARRADALPELRVERAKAVSLRIRLRADLELDEVPMGGEGVQELPPRRR